MALIESLLLLVGIVLALSVWSVAFKDNPLFRFAEHTLVGASGGYFTVVVLESIWRNGVSPVYEGKNVWFILPLIAGVLIFTRWTKWPWMYRYPLAVVVSTGTGLALRSAIQAQILSQARATMIPISTNLLMNFNNVVMMVATVCCLTYFLFTTPQAGRIGRALGYSTKLARYFLMLTFGAGLATFIMQAYIYLITSVAYVVNSLLGR